MKLFRVGFLGLLLFLAACGTDGIETNMSETVPDFSYTSQDNESFGLDDLKGEWWIADFIFTNCTTVCIPMTNNMVALQNDLDDAGLDVELVSFSVDPDYDTPEVLTEYAESYGADLSNWNFLTGYDFDTISELSVKTFKQAILAPGPDSDQVTHGTRFFLINPEGEIVKSYDGAQSDSIQEIVDDLNNIL